MIKQDYEKLEAYMKKCAQDTSHDSEHIYRVLYIAMEIAAAEEQAGESVDYDVLIAACLLHDIGRAEELTDPSVCHASIGAEKAYRFL